MTAPETPNALPAGRAPDDVYRAVAAEQATRWGYHRTLDAAELAKWIHDQAQDPNLRADVDATWRLAMARLGVPPYPAREPTPNASEPPAPRAPWTAVGVAVVDPNGAMVGRMATAELAAQVVRDHDNAIRLAQMLDGALERRDRPAPTVDDSVGLAIRLAELRDEVLAGLGSDTHIAVSRAEWAAIRAERAALLARFEAEYQDHISTMAERDQLREALAGANAAIGRVRSLAARAEGYDFDLVPEQIYEALGLAGAASPTPKDAPKSAAIVTDETLAERAARRFHEAYERLAPQHSYETRKASAVPWEKVPANNRALMCATVAEVLEWLAEQGRLVPDGAMVDMVLPDGTHRYWSTHCRHDRHADCASTVLAPGVERQPAQCKTCAAPCPCPCHSVPAPAGDGRDD